MLTSIQLSVGSLFCQLISWFSGDFEPFFPNFCQSDSGAAKLPEKLTDTFCEHLGLLLAHLFGLAKILDLFQLNLYILTGELTNFLVTGSRNFKIPLDAST